MTNKEYEEWHGPNSVVEEIRLEPTNCHHRFGDVRVMGKVNGRWVQLYLDFEEGYPRCEFV